MDLFFLITNIIFSAFCLRYSFFWWFRGNEYAKMNRKKRIEYRKKLFFMPQTLMFDYYDRDPLFEIWINRILSLIFLAAGILGIFISVRGPF